MNVSAAKAAASSFSQFAMNPARASRFTVAVPVPWSAWHIRFGNLSDYLNLWVLGGEAHKHCAGDFAVFMQAVIIVFAEAEQWDEYPTQRLMRHKPGRAGSEDRALPADDEYELPIFFDEEQFYASANLDDNERVALLRKYIETHLP